LGGVGEGGNLTDYTTDAGLGSPIALTEYRPGTAEAQMSKEKKSASIDDQKGGNVTPKEEEKTGAGAEATEGMDGEAKGASHKHRSAYGGNGGTPKLPNS
jgi:hypothetical protein